MNKLKNNKRQELITIVKNLMDNPNYHYTEDNRRYKKRFPYNLKKIGALIKLGQGATRAIINDILQEQRQNKKNPYNRLRIPEEKVKRVLEFSEMGVFKLKSDDKIYNYDYPKMGHQLEKEGLNLSLNEIEKIIKIKESLEGKLIE